MFKRKTVVLRSKKYSKVIKIAIIVVAVIASSCLIAYGWQKYDEKKYPNGAEKDYKLPNAFIDFFQMASDFVNRKNVNNDMSEDSSEQSSLLSEESREDTHMIVGGNSSESSSSAEETQQEEPEIKGGIVPEGEAASEYAFRNTLFVGDYFVFGVSVSEYFVYSSSSSAQLI